MALCPTGRPNHTEYRRLRSALSAVSCCSATRFSEPGGELDTPHVYPMSGRAYEVSKISGEPDPESRAAYHSVTFTKEMFPCGLVGFWIDTNAAAQGSSCCVSLRVNATPPPVSQPSTIDGVMAHWPSTSSKDAAASSDVPVRRSSTSRTYPRGPAAPPSRPERARRTSRQARPRRGAGPTSLVALWPSRLDPSALHRASPHHGPMVSALERARSEGSRPLRPAESPQFASFSRTRLSVR